MVIVVASAHIHSHCLQGVKNFMAICSFFGLFFSSYGGQEFLGNLCPFSLGRSITINQCSSSRNNPQNKKEIPTGRAGWTQNASCPTLCRHRGKGVEREVTGLSEATNQFYASMTVAPEAAGISCLPCLPNWPQFKFTFAVTPSLTNSGRLWKIKFFLKIFTVLPQWPHPVER